MKAIHLPIGDHAAHRTVSAASRNCLAATLSRDAPSLASLAGEATAVQAIAGELGPFVGGSVELVDDGSRLQRAFARLDRCEQPLVQFAVRSSRHPAANSFRRGLNWVGNGWLYLFAAVALLLWQGSGAVRPILAAACAAGCAVVFYTSVKPLLGRLRPRDFDPLLRLPIEPQDKYSCPSGHSMSAAAIAVPLLLSFPHFQVVVLTIGGLIAWSRVACGHHYPSDVLLGIVLGVALSAPICGWML